MLFLCVFLFFGLLLSAGFSFRVDPQQKRSRGGNCSSHCEKYHWNGLRHGGEDRGSAERHSGEERTEAKRCRCLLSVKDAGIRSDIDKLDPSHSDATYQEENRENDGVCVLQPEDQHHYASAGCGKITE